MNGFRMPDARRLGTPLRPAPAGAARPAAVAQPAAAPLSATPMSDARTGLDERTELDAELGERFALGRPWRTIVWNDPVNLMSYVTYVFTSYFGFTEQRATELMLAVHHEGKAVVAHGTREEMERHVQAMHEYGLWATLDRDEA